MSARRSGFVWAEKGLLWRRPNGLQVHFHWTCVLVLVLALVLTQRQIIASTAAFAACMFLVAAHELGHATAAVRQGLRVFAINVGPVHGVCWAEAPQSRRGLLQFALGGVLAQASILLVAVACLLATRTFAVELPQALAAVLFVLGPWNFVLLVANLLPLKGLDGYVVRQALIRASANDRAHTLRPTILNEPADIVDLAQRRATRKVDE